MIIGQILATLLICRFNDSLGASAQGDVGEEICKRGSTGMRASSSAFQELRQAVYTNMLIAQAGQQSSPSDMAT